MRQTKKGFSYDEHKAAGRELKQMRDRLVHLSVDLANTYGTSSKVARGSKKAYETLDDLRSELDNIVGRDCPDRSDLELNHIYFPPKAETARSGK
jgi:hypothetical protein